MKSYEPLVREIYAPLVKRYNLQFAALDNDEFFLVGYGFALWVFIDPKDRRADTWYVSIDNSGDVLTYTLLYINKERFTPEERTFYGNPITFDDHIAGDMRVLNMGLLNRCQDILTGDKTWLKGYQGKGHYSRHVTKFLTPYFKAQGYPVIARE